jgi:UDP-N-acetylglucosamine 2-epimerase (non-hydrolysing)
MHKLKVMTIVGTRPEIIRLSRIIAQLDLHCDHTIVHTGQNYDYELNELFFEELGIRKPDIFLNAAGKNAAETIGQIIIKLDAFLDESLPEAVLILGDTNSSLAAIPVKKKKIPIFHMEAGNRCFDLRVPEEVNRKIVDHISDINLTYSDIAREYLLREGFPPDQIIKIGSPMCEVLEYYKDKISISNILSTLDLVSKNYFVVSCHREENVDSEKNLKIIMDTLNLMATHFKKPIIFSTHPRTKKKLETFLLDVNPLIKFCKPFGFFDYIKLQCEAICTLSDSGTITEESSILNFPALNLREVHERPEGFEEGAVMMVGINFDRIVQAINILKLQKKSQYREMNIVKDYDIPNVSLKVVRIIQSYTDFVNRKVWKKIH